MGVNDNYGLITSGDIQGLLQREWYRSPLQQVQQESVSQQSIQQAIGQMRFLGQLTHPTPMTYAGSSILVVCNGLITEMPAAATLEAAQAVAERLAHQQQTEAFILKPVRKVAPKRDVVTTDL